MFGWLKKTASKADEALDQAKEDMSNTAEKVQKVLDESSKSVNIIIDVVLATLAVSIVGNVMNIGFSIAKHKRENVPSKIIIQNLYLCAPKGRHNEQK